MTNGRVGREQVAIPIRAAGLTDVGCVRLNNEDACFVDVGMGLFIVSDGVGGHAYGDVASRMVVDLLPCIIKRRISEAPDPRTDDDPAIGEMLGDSINELSRHVHEWSKEVPESYGMGATVVVALVTGRHMHIVHMGDSRAYLLRNGVMRLLTQDHSVVSLLIQHGEITDQQAAVHPARGRLTRYVGMEAAVQSLPQTLEIQSGDRLMLCTDGLWGMVSSEVLTLILARHADAEMTCLDLVVAGKKAGGADNLTAVVVMVE